MNKTKKCPRDLCLFATTVPEYNYCPICGQKLEVIDGTAYSSKSGVKE
jgi:hypothetical protein